jgi:DNA-binding SARP family transcriptional activator
VAHDLRISVLGAFEVDLDGRSVGQASWRRNRARALVKLLALATGHHLHREQLIDALWPALDPEAGARNLRKAAFFARQALGAEHLVNLGESIALSAPNLWVDVRAFEDAIAAGRRSEAIALYRGDLLPDDLFEPWTEDPRERLRLRLHRLLLDEAAEQEATGKIAEAIDSLERLVASEPLHDEAHLALVRLLALSGARHRALLHYRQFADRLRLELDVEPEPGLRRVADEIASGRFQASASAARPGADGTEGPESLVDDEELRLVTVVSAAVRAGAAHPRFAGPVPDAWDAEAMSIIASWGGRGQRLPGGAVLGVFGVPAAHEDDRARALQASLEIVRLAAGSAQVGVASGEAIITSEPDSTVRRTSGAALADAVALREAADPGVVLASDRVSFPAPEGFRFASSITVQIGGRAQAARRLLGVEPIRAGPTSSDAPLVGREPELAVVLGLFEDAVANGQPRLVELSGAAGVGKSRLAAEVVDQVAYRYPGARILRGRCQPAGRGAAFDALGDILRDACGVSITDTADQARARLRRGLAGLLADVEPIDIEPTTIALAITAGIVMPGNALEDLPPAERSDRFAMAWSVCATACAASSPAVLLIEDVHWAQLELLELIERMVHRARGPLLVLVTARPELHESGLPFAGGDLSTIVIRPLGEAHSEQLLGNLVEGDELDERVRGDLLARAEGNPFYLEQLIHHVRYGGPGSLPDTLQSLLTARLDGLPHAERRVLQEASVIGRTFWEAPIAAALEGERVSARLVSLERRGFVTRRSTSSLPGQAEYAIRHALLHDVTYESLAPARRARAHAATGAWLEGLAGDRVNEVIELIAHHYWAAVAVNEPQLAPNDGFDRQAIRAKAFELTLRAGDAARQRFITERAIELHGRTLAIAATPAEQLIALEALGRDHEEAFHGDAAAARYGEALDIARTDPATAGDRARLCRRLGWMMAWIPGGFRANPAAAHAEALIDEGMAHAVDPGEKTWLLLARGACARLYRGSEPLGQGTEVDPQPVAQRLAAAEQALADARRLELHEVVVAAEFVLGMLYGQAGDYEAMIELARRQVAHLRPEDSRIEQSDAIRKLATTLVNVRADFEQGLELGRRCRELAGGSGAGGPHQVMHTLWPILASLFFLGRWDELMAPMDEHVAAFRIEPAMECQFVRDGPAITASVLTLLGRTAEAREVAALLGDPLANRQDASAWQARLALFRGDPETAHAIARDKAIEGRVYGPQHAAVLLDALAELGDWSGAAEFLPLAREAQAGNALVGPTADRVEGLVSLATGDQAKAARLIRRSIRGFRRLKVPFEEARSFEMLGRTLPTPGARIARTAASEIYLRLGVRTATGGQVAGGVPIDGPPRVR